MICNFLLLLELYQTVFRKIESCFSSEPPQESAMIFQKREICVLALQYAQNALLSYAPNFPEKRKVMAH